MIYYCCDERRRNDIKGHAYLNGIDFLEVVDNKSDPYEQRQRTLLVHFINELAPGSLNKENVWIEGGERIRNIKVIDTNVSATESPPLTSPPDGPLNVLEVEVDKPGDFSTYTLHIVQDTEHKEPPDGFDPILSSVDFSFKVACPSDFDCKPRHICSTGPGTQPEINYLAKDYASFRRLMLDRMAVLMPQWNERNPADLGIVLVELLAYVGDYLSYRQDAVATEAYLGTSRRRVSVRRHARLVDYFMHDGCNARVWVQLRVSIDNIAVKKGTQLLTKTEGEELRIHPKSSEYDRAMNKRPVVFETMHDITLFKSHYEMPFYAWGARECCLPKGATRATLRGKYENLKRGDILVLSEIRSPKNGSLEDADPTKRHAVCLTEVNYKEDPIEEEYSSSPPDSSPPIENSVPVTEIKWHPDDALPFPFCISARNDTNYYDGVSVALGNIVLADHGRTFKDVPDADQSSLEPDTVPEPNPVLTKVSISGDDRCERGPVKLTLPRFRPVLKRSPLTHAAPYDIKNPPVSASAAMEWSIQEVLPQISLSVPGTAGNWQSRRNLLNSRGSDKDFVVEIENDGMAFIRFGDNQHGRRPAKNTKFLAVYRIGNGVSGNVGLKSIVHIVSNDPAIIKVSNPLSAKEGIGPESIEEALQKAPSAFRRQERAVTPEDYADMAKRCDSSVQRAAATFRWTGSWHTVFLTVDRLGGKEVDGTFERDMRKCLERYRMAGHDLEVDGPRYVSLEIEMIVCVKPDYFRSDVKAALLEVFSSRILSDGRKGVFHPDNFTFEQVVYLSPHYAAAMATQGVASVKITKFQRQGIDSNKAIENGKLELGRLEISRLDNDPNFRERGVLNLIMRGGR